MPRIYLLGVLGARILGTIGAVEFFKKHLGK
jgi:hypothetical protein